MPSQLVTTSAAVNWIGITSNATNNAMVSALNTRVGGIIVDWCNRDPDGFASASHTEKFDGLCADRLVLTYTPIVTTPTITVDGQTMDSDLYTFESNTGVVGIKWSDWDLWFRGSFPNYNQSSPIDHFSMPNFGRGFRATTVQYVGGYASNAIPVTVQQAALEVIAYLWYKRTINPLIQSKTLADLSYTNRASTAWRDFQQEIIELYLSDHVRKSVLITP